MVRRCKAGGADDSSTTGINVSDIFDEVEQDLRADRATRMLKKYGGWLIGAALLVVAGSAAWQGWTWYTTRLNTRMATLFLDATRTLDAPPADQTPDARTRAMADLTRVIAEAGPGYRTLARLRLAAVKADSGAGDDAAALWRAVADDSAAEPMLRNVATLDWAMHDIDKGDPAALTARLQPLAAPDSPLHGLADEALGLLALREGRIDAARDIFKRLMQDPSLPDGVRGRANGVLTQMGG